MDFLNIAWVVPLPSNSDHQDCFMFRGSQPKPSFATGILRGGLPPKILLMLVYHPSEHIPGDVPKPRFHVCESGNPTFVWECNPPPKSNIDTENDGFLKCRILSNMASFWVSMLVLGSVMYIFLGTS